MLLQAGGCGRTAAAGRQVNTHGVQAGRMVGFLRKTEETSKVLAILYMEKLCPAIFDLLCKRIAINPNKSLKESL